MRAVGRNLAGLYRSSKRNHLTRGVASRGEEEQRSTSFIARRGKPEMPVDDHRLFELERVDDVEIWQRLAPQPLAVLAERPYRKDVSVVGVGDHAIVVEDARDELLRPIPRRLLNERERDD
eukprot:scaffold190489_cov29-Tisochrysis_lutea.AAC.3